jgi:sirohydrochlorin ferrochelatase
MPETIDETKSLAAGVQSRLGTRYDRVVHAFLEFAEPSYEKCLEDCIKAGATEIVVLPYLLSVGRHLRKDIPDLIRIKEAEYPNISFKVAPYVGSADGLLDLLLSLVP